MGIKKIKMYTYKYWKSTIIGLSMLVYSYYSYHHADIIEKWSYDFWFISCSAFLGFMLLFSGDKFIDRIIDIVINAINKKLGK